MKDRSSSRGFSEIFWNRKKESAFMRLDLKFNEKPVEDSYKQFIQGYIQKYFRFFQIVVLLSLAVNWLLNPLDTDNFSGRSLILNLIQVILNLLAAIYLSFKKDFRYPEIGIFVLQVYTCVGYIETSFQKNSNLFSRTNYITTSTLLEMNSLVSMISRSSWKINCLSSLFLNSYLGLRYVDLKDNNEMRGLPTIVFFANFLIISLGAYFHEKYDRNLFYQRYNSEKSLKRFEEIIREVLPSSIMIFKENELLFFNDETRRMFNINNSRGLEEKIKDISISTSEYKSSEERRVSQEIKQSGKRLSFQESKYENTNLFSYFKRLMNVDKKIGFIRLTGSIKNSPKSINLDDVEDNLLENEMMFLEIKIGKLLWEGKDALMIICSEDFAMQRLQYFQEQGKYKDQLLATVSHDLRTPLNGIIGILDHILESTFDKGIRKSLQLALRSSNLLLFMINDILDFSQISNGSLNLSPALFCLEEMITDVTKLIKFQAKRKGIAFEVLNQLPKGEKRFIYSDPNRLKQVILNLLGNALKFTQNGFVRISFAVHQIQDEILTDENSLPVSITVEDSGCGIKREDIPKLFKLFGMLSNPETEKINPTGVGLGLAISQNLVKLLNNYRQGGEITVKSEYGKGSVFSFLLYHYFERKTKSENATRSPDSKTISGNDIFFNFPDEEDSIKIIDETNEQGILPLFAPKSNYSIIQNLKRKLRVLLVDDDQINLLVLTNFFEKFEDCEFHTASNGKQALDVIFDKAKVKEFFDIIFMDCNMPVMDGFKATQSILSLVSAGQIPKLFIIASTANASESDRKICLNSGMSDILTKPFTKNALREKLDLYSRLL